MNKPLIQIDDEIREMTVEEIAELEASRADTAQLGASDE